MRLSPDQLERYRRALEAEAIRRSPAWRGPRRPRPKQLEPEGDWFVWMVLAGRGWGKTLTGAEWAAGKARRYPGARIALVAQAFADGRDTMVEGEAGLLSVFEPHELRDGDRDRAWNRSLGELVLANGSRFKVLSSEKPRQLRGPQHHFAWGDEPATWYDSRLGPVEDTTWSNLALGLRLSIDGSEPRVLLTGTPRPVRLLTERDRDPPGLLHRESTVITRGHTDENVGNLAEAYRLEVVEPLRGTRVGRQELAAEILEQVEGALVTRAHLDAGRVASPPKDGRLSRCVVGLDPASGEAGAEQGIAVVGLSPFDHELYLIKTDGMRTSPLKWLTHAIRLASSHGASIVAEKTGSLGLGELLEQAIRETGLRVPYRLVSATESKLLRGQRMGMLFETGKLHLVGNHPVLEDQLTSYAPGGPSPDRLDAAAHAVNEVASYRGSPGEAAVVPWSDAPPVPGDAVVAWEDPTDWSSQPVSGEALERWVHPSNWLERPVTAAPGRPEARGP
jgi:phage terminase large subunit-like protein